MRDSIIEIPKLLNQMRFWIHLGLDLQFREKLNVEPVPCQMNVWKAGVEVENPAKLVVIRIQRGTSI